MHVFPKKGLLREILDELEEGPTDKKKLEKVFRYQSIVQELMI